MLPRAMQRARARTARGSRDGVSRRRLAERHHAAVDVHALAVAHDADLGAVVAEEVHAVVVGLHAAHAEEAAAAAARGAKRAWFVRHGSIVAERPRAGHERALRGKYADLGRSTDARLRASGVRWTHQYRPGARERSGHAEADAKPALEQFSYGLYVIGSKDGGEVNGMTANWLTQVSFEPRMVALAVESQSHTLKNIKASMVFSINVIDEADTGLIEKFVEPQERAGNKLGGVAFRTAETGCPILERRSRGSSARSRRS
jgi:hypothetical protein